jgi:hypothetical protein
VQPDSDGHGGVTHCRRQGAERLPVPPGQARDVARILDRLAEEIGQAAGMLRVVSGTVSAPAGPVYNPWAVVRLVTRELVREGVRPDLGDRSLPRFGLQSGGRVPQCIDRECSQAVSEGEGLLSGVEHVSGYQPGA